MATGKADLPICIERPPEERDAFLARACQDNPALRNDVESLIVSHDQAGDSIEAMAAEAAAPDQHYRDSLFLASIYFGRLQSEPNEPGDP